MSVRKQTANRLTLHRVCGTCGKQIPVVCLRLYYDGEETHKDFLFEKPQSVEQILEAIRECRPELSMDLETLKTAQSASADWINEHGTDDTPEAMALRSRIADLFTRAEGTMN